MKFILEREPLLGALSRLAPIASATAGIPILAMVLIEAFGDHVRFRASNLTIEVVETIPCEPAATGATAVLGSALHDIVKNAAAGSQVAFDLGARLAVKSGRSRFQLATQPPADFPALMAGVLPGSFEIDAAPFRDMLTRTAWAAGKEVTRFFCMGVHLKQIGDLLFACGTDTKRLAAVSVTAPEGCKNIALTLPNASVAEVLRILGEGAVRVSWGESLLSVQSGAAIITSKLVAKEFVNFPLAWELPRAIRLDRGDLQGMLRRLMISADTDNPIVRLAFGGDVIKGNSRRAGANGDDEIGAEYDGPEFTANFVGPNLAACLAGLKGDVMELHFNETVEKFAVLKAPMDPATIINLGLAVG